MGEISESNEAITIHLGRKPVRGGRPPRDSKRRESVRMFRSLDRTVEEKSLGVVEFRKNR